MHTICEKRIRMLNPREIKAPKYRVRNSIDEHDLLLLRDSIAAGGLVTPLTVKKSLGGTYRLISGEMRLRAAIMAGLRRVPCVVHNLDDNTAVLYAIGENTRRSPLSVFEEAEAINFLISKKGMSLQETASKIGVSQSELTEKLSVLRLEQKQRLRVVAAGLTCEHIKSILELPKECREEALDTVIEREMTAKETKDYVFSILNPKLKTNEDAESKKTFKKTAIGDVRLFSNSIVKLIETAKSGGIKATIKKTESERYIEYKIKIKKETTDKEEVLQLKLCQ